MLCERSTSSLTLVNKLAHKLVDLRSQSANEGPVAKVPPKGMQDVEGKPKEKNYKLTPHSNVKNTCKRKQNLNKNWICETNLRTNGICGQRRSIYGAGPTRLSTLKVVIPDTLSSHQAWGITDVYAMGLKSPSPLTFCHPLNSTTRRCIDTARGYDAIDVAPEADSPMDPQTHNEIHKQTLN